MKNLKPLYFLSLFLIIFSCSFLGAKDHVKRTPSSYQDQLICADPQKDCVKEISGTASTFKPIKKLPMGLGVFCSTPVPTKANQFISVCDGTKADPLSGQFIIFDNNLNVIKKVKLPSKDEKYTVTSSEKPLVRLDSTGKAKDIVLSTRDGRILFYDLAGSLKKTLKFDFDYLQSPIVLADGKLAAVASDPSSYDHKLYVFNDEKILENVELTAGSGYSGIYSVGENLYTVSFEGKLTGYDKDRNKNLDIVVEKGSTLSPPTLFKGSSLLIGSQSGTLFEIDAQTGAKRVFYKAEPTGEVEPGLGKDTPSKPMQPNIVAAPIVLEDGRVVISTAGDGRVHMLKPSGSVEWQVTTEHVRDMLAFSKLPGTDHFYAASTTFMSIVGSDGLIKAKFSNSTAENGGAENFFKPIALGNNRFLVGMFNGVHLFELKATSEKTKNNIKWPCDK